MSMLTAAELSEFIRTADKLLTETERQDVIDYLAVHPKTGDLLEGTGGVRKLRWGAVVKAKAVAFASSYFYDELMPLYLLTLFAKGDKDNLTKAERNELQGLVQILVQIWERKE